MVASPENRVLLRDIRKQGRPSTPDEFQFIGSRALVIDGATESEGKTIYPFPYEKPLEPIVPKGYNHYCTDTVYLDGVYVRLADRQVYDTIPAGKVAICQNGDGNAVMIISDSTRGDQEIPIPEYYSRDLLRGLDELMKLEQQAHQHDDVNCLLVNAYRHAIDSLKQQVPIVSRIRQLLGQGIPVQSIALMVTKPSLKTPK